METVIIVIHLMVVLALVGVILIQRSEGGGLGIGGGSGFMTARGAANALTRATAILAAAFFVTALGLSILARYGGQPGDILDRAPAAPATGGQSGGGGVLNQLGGAPAQPVPPSGGSSDATQAPAAAPSGGASSAPAATAPAPSEPANAAAPAPQPAPATPQVPSGQ